LGGFGGGDWAADVEHCLPYLVFTAGNVTINAKFSSKKHQFKNIKFVHTI
jgi:hypothetical protein